MDAIATVLLKGGNDDLLGTKQFQLGVNQINVNFVQNVVDMDFTTTYQVAPDKVYQMFSTTKPALDCVWTIPKPPYLSYHVEGTGARYAFLTPSLFYNPNAPKPLNAFNRNWKPVKLDPQPTDGSIIYALRTFDSPKLPVINPWKTNDDAGWANRAISTSGGITYVLCVCSYGTKIGGPDDVGDLGNTFDEFYAISGWVYWRIVWNFLCTGVGVPPVLTWAQNPDPLKASVVMGRKWDGTYTVDSQPIFGGSLSLGSVDNASFLDAPHVLKVVSPTAVGPIPTPSSDPNSRPIWSPP